MRVKLINYTEDPVMAMARAASVCYRSEPSKAVVEKCLEAGHLSIAEFVTFHFLIEDVSRVLSHQLVRKRMASYAQESQRYVDMGDNFNYYIPPSVIDNQYSYKEYTKFMKTANEFYRKLVETYHIPIEAARYVIPNAAYTRLHMAINFRSLMEFCNQRMCIKAQREIWNLAYALKDRVQEVAPFLAGYLRPKCEAIGKCTEIKSCKDFY